MDKNFVVIKCPKCGYEYLPCEIFYPEDLLGSAKDIIRDEEGKIKSFRGTSLDLTETYVCDHCETEFVVSGSVEFKTVSEDFDEEESYVIPKKEKLTL